MATCRPSGLNCLYIQRDLGTYFRAEPFKLFLQDMYEIQPLVYLYLRA